MNSDILHVFDHTCTLSGRPAKSLRPYLKGMDLHLSSEITLCFLVCVSEIPVVNPTAVVSSTEEPAG